MFDPKTLSQDARIVLGAHFSFGDKTKLTLQTPWNVTTRGKAALDELVAAGVLKLAIGEESLYGHTYQPTDRLDGFSVMPWFQKEMEDADLVAAMRGFYLVHGRDSTERSERPPADWPLPAGHKRHPK